MLEDLLKSHDNRVVIFGCGGLGRRAIEKLFELGVQPLALCDNNAVLWGTEIQGVPVLSVADAAAKFGRDALFVVAVWNPHHWFGETAQKLREAGARSISTYLPLYWRFPTDFLQVYLLNDLPSKIYSSMEKVLEAEGLWADDESLQVYRANILWRALGDASCMPPRPVEDTYFPPDIFAPLRDECMIDCGAYNGDTIKQVLRYCGADFSAIYSLEGDCVSFEKLQAYVATLPEETGRKIHPIHAAVGGTRTVVRFGSDGGTGSKIGGDEESGIAVECFPLDMIDTIRPITMVKMDIEGAEYEALLGGSGLIVRDQPLLAICVYHCQDDIWRIPLLIRAMLPTHHLFLRAYEGDGFQTVLYAVPPGRMLSDAKRAAAPK